MLKCVKMHESEHYSKEPPKLQLRGYELLRRKDCSLALDATLGKFSNTLFPFKSAQQTLSMLCYTLMLFNFHHPDKVYVNVYVVLTSLR